MLWIVLLLIGITFVSQKLPGKVIPVKLCNVLIRPDRTICDIHPTDGKNYTLTELQLHVGGYIQWVPILASPYVMVLDEDAIYKQLSLNTLATEIMLEGIAENEKIIKDMMGQKLGGKVNLVTPIFNSSEVRIYGTVVIIHHTTIPR